MLFNIYSEYVFREVKDERTGGISIGGMKLNNVRYADNTTLTASDQNELEAITDMLTTISKIYGLELNRNKIKVMIISRTNNNLPHMRSITGFELVQSLIYLGKLITNSGSKDKIKHRLAIARPSTIKLTKI